MISLWSCLFVIYLFTGSVRLNFIKKKKKKVFCFANWRTLFLFTILQLIWGDNGPRTQSGRSNCDIRGNRTRVQHAGWTVSLPKQAIEKQSSNCDLYPKTRTRHGIQKGHNCSIYPIWGIYRCFHCKHKSSTCWGSFYPISENKV